MLSPPIRRPTFDAAPPLRSRIEIGPAGHPLEDEADRMADSALGGGAKADFSTVPVVLRRRPGPGARAGTTGAESLFEGAGRPLDDALRQDMEGRFGHDFSQVRIHSDPSAARSAGALDAEAYAMGRHIAFGGGRFAPETEGGRRLLAHELAHVVQQGSSPEPVLRRQAKGGKKKKKQTPAKDATPAKKASTIGGEVAEGDPLTPAELARVQAAGEKVPAQFRRYVVYKDVIKVGGSLAWRFNNPGNLRSSPQQLARLKGGVGKFAAFKDMATGRQAQRDLYLNTYGEMSVRDAVEKLTPRTENDTTAYLKALAKGGVDLDKKVAPQIDILMREVEKNEGLIEGTTLTRDAAATPAEPGAWKGVPWALPEPADNTDSWPGAPWRLPGGK